MTIEEFIASVQSLTETAKRLEIVALRMEKARPHSNSPDNPGTCPLPHDPHHVTGYLNFPMTAAAKPENFFAAIISAADLPMPVTWLFESGYTSLTSLRKWRMLGLQVKWYPGLGNGVLPSELRRFLLEQGGETPKGRLDSLKAARAIGQKKRGRA